MSRIFSTAVLLFACLLALGISASADPIAIANPGGTTTEIGARIRWGATGYEASVYDSNPLNQSPTLNPVGTPFWALNQPYKFEVVFTGSTGVLGLSVDFDGNSNFGAGEVITRSAFAAPGFASYQGYGFKYLSISGNESGSTGRSTVSSLEINGTSLDSLSPGGTLLEQFYKDSTGNPMADITITGTITFLTAGTNQERPGWDFRFRNAEIPTVPDGGTTSMLLAMGLAGLAGVRRLLHK